MGLLQEIWQEFSANGLYELFGVSRQCSSAELKKAYLEAARKCHPDKAEPDQAAEATRKFQILSRAHAILSNAETRKIYDQTGDVDDESVSAASAEEWTEYFRRMFPKISFAKISNFKKDYQASGEEMADLKAAYLKHEGDMGAVYEEVMLSNPAEDEERFRQAIDAWIAEGSVPAFKAYSQEKPAARKRRMDKARKEADEAAQQRRQFEERETRDSQTALAAMLSARQKERDAMWARFEEKHTSKAKKRAQRDNVPLDSLEEPSEAEFLATQARLEAQRAKREAKGKKSAKGQPTVTEEAEDDAEDDELEQENGHPSAAQVGKKAKSMKGKAKTERSASSRSAATSESTSSPRARRRG